MSDLHQRLTADVREADAEAERGALKARVAELEADAKGLVQENVRLENSVRNWREGAERVEKERAGWRTQALDAEERLREAQDELAHEKGGRIDEAAIRAACEQETGAWPYGRIVDAVVSTLRAQQARWEAFVEAEAERAEKAEARVAELERERDEAVAVLRAAMKEVRFQRARFGVEPCDPDLRSLLEAVLAKYPEGR